MLYSKSELPHGPTREVRGSWQSRVEGHKGVCVDRVNSVFQCLALTTQVEMF